MLDGNVIADSLGLTELIAGLIGASIDASSGLTFGQTVYGLITAFFPIVVSVCSVVLLIMLMYGPDNASASAGNLRKSGK